MYGAQAQLLQTGSIRTDATRNVSLQEPISARTDLREELKGVPSAADLSGDPVGGSWGEILPGAVPHAYGRHGGCYTFVRSSTLCDLLSSVYALRGRIANRTRTDPFNFLKFSTSLAFTDQL